MFWLIIYLPCFDHCVLFSSLVFFSFCLLLMWATESGFRRNALKLFDSSLVLLCLSAPSQKKVFKPQSPERNLSMSMENFPRFSYGFAFETFLLRRRTKTAIQGIYIRTTWERLAYCHALLHSSVEDETEQKTQEDKTQGSKQGKLIINQNILVLPRLIWRRFLIETFADRTVLCFDHVRSVLFWRRSSLIYLNTVNK